MGRPRFRRTMIVDGVARVSLLGFRLITLDAQVERRDPPRLFGRWRSGAGEADLVEQRRDRRSSVRRTRDRRSSRDRRRSTRFVLERIR